MCFYRKGAKALITTAIVLGIQVGLQAIHSDANAQEIKVPEAGASPTIDKIRSLGELRSGIAISAPWLLQDPATGDYQGVSIEIGKRLAKEIGVPLKIVASNWDVFIAGLQAGQFEIALAPAFATPKRLEVVDFVNYTAAGSCFAALATNEKVNKLDDLNKPEIRIGTLTGTGAEQGVKAKYTNATIDSVVGSPGMITRIPDVLSGRVDVTSFDSPLAIVIAHDFPDLKIIPDGPQGCMLNPDTPFPTGVSVRKGDPAYEGFIEAVVKSMKDSGEIDKLIADYSTIEYMRLQ